MDPASPAEVAKIVVAAANGRPVSTGGPRLVCIDGPAGSGKTTLAAAVVARTGAELVHMDDLMAGWAGGVDTEAALTQVVVPWCAGRPASYLRYDWHAECFDRPVDVPAGPWLVVEGVGSGRRSLAPWVTLLVWVEVDDDLRLARGLRRDGEGAAPQWEAFMAAEAGLFAAEHTRERADVLVDGTGARPPVLR